MYSKGKKASGVINNIYYKAGKKATGVASNKKLYVNGEPNKGPYYYREKWYLNTAVDKKKMLRLRRMMKQLML